VLEFALVFPLFVAVVFGLIDYGWYFYQKFTFASAIREGVRYGATYRDDPLGTPALQPDAQAQTEAERRCRIGSVPTTGTAKATLTASLTGAFPLRAVRIQGTYRFIPLVGLVRMPNPNLTYTMEMLLEQQF
jgi:Flp pilus assembly protein TadG